VLPSWHGRIETCKETKTKSKGLNTSDASSSGAKRAAQQLETEQVPLSNNEIENLHWVEAKELSSLPLKAKHKNGESCSKTISIEEEKDGEKDSEDNKLYKDSASKTESTSPVKIQSGILCSQKILIGNRTTCFGNNWMKKIPRTAEIGLGLRPRPIWQSEEFFEFNYFRIGQAKTKTIQLIRKLSN
jgi:hypothetical protein